MSAPRALKATSLRDSLAKTVRLLTKQGIDVRFRGCQPMVEARGNKAVRLTLPEVNDSAPPELIESIQGFLDHEVGHIFYTPFERGKKFARNNRMRHGLCNIVEDIRLEKLLPRDLPGTKENLERMYDKSIPFFFAPSALKANEPGQDPSEAFSCVMVAALRALAGQKAFQKFMDDNGLWQHFKPLLVKMPDLSTRLRKMETFDDVEGVCEDIIEALRPPPPPPTPPAGQSDDQSDDKSDEQGGGFDPDSDDMSPEDEDDAGASDSVDEGGEGHGEGEGTDDGEDEDGGDCSGDDAGDDDEGAGDDGDGIEDAGEESDAGGDDDSGSSAGDDEDDRGEENNPDGNTGGKNNRPLTDALKLLEPTQRRALLLYKKRKQTVSQIAETLSLTEEETEDLLRNARRRLSELMKGD